MSYSFNYLDSKILDLLKEYKEIKYWKLIAECMSKSLGNFCSDVIFKLRIDEMINNNIIKIVKVVEEKDFLGEMKQVKYISVND